jgi:hypothetical protein
LKSWSVSHSQPLIKDLTYSGQLVPLGFVCQFFKFFNFISVQLGPQISLTSLLFEFWLYKNNKLPVPYIKIIRIPQFHPT